jgi:spore germination protein KB
MNRLTSWQLYSLLVLFQLGTSVVFGLSSPAKQDAWITVLISALPGGALLWAYSKLFETRPNANWTGLLQFAFGRYAGSLLGIIYVFIFIYSAARDLRDLGELTNTFLLPQTPMVITMLMFQMLVAYICFAGIERMGRMAEMNVPIILLLFVLQIVLLITSGSMQLSLITPVAENWKLILTSVFPGNYTVPYAEAFAFAAFWSLTRPPKQFRNMVLISAATVGAFLTVLDILAICMVGPELFSRSFFPLMSTFHLINLGDFIQNIDPVIVTNYMIGVLFKVSIFTYAALTVISDIWNVQGHKVAVIPVSIVIVLFALYMAENLSSHLFTGHAWVPWVIFLPFFVVLPMLVLSVVKIKTFAGEGKT